MAPTSPRTPDWSLPISLEGKRNGVSGKDIALAVLLALFSTSISYHFGTGNQLEQIPMILRQLDPAYLGGDFFVSSSVDFGPRFYYARFIAWVCGTLPLPWAFFIFTFLTDLALVAVTLWGSRHAKRTADMPPERFQDMVIWLFISGIIGARVLYMIQYAHHFPDKSILGLIGAFFKIWEGGIIFYGSALGGVIGYGLFYWFVLRRLKINGWKLVDPRHIQLQGTSCKTLMDKAALVDARFPCTGFSPD